MVYFVGMTNETMFVRTADGVEHCFLVWVARTYADLGRGLAGLRGLDADRGMVLDFGSTILASVTMRGMLFPLDIVFLNSGGFVCFQRLRSQTIGFLGNRWQGGLWSFPQERSSGLGSIRRHTSDSRCAHLAVSSCWLV